MFYFRSVLPILALVSPLLLWTQEPHIAHVPVTCLPMDGHSVIGAETSPQNAFQTARVYFRSNVFAVFYYVDMARTAGAFYAVLPTPEPTSDSVVYYIEAYDARAGAIRTPDYEAFVMSDAESCRSQDLDFAVHSGDNPRIVLGSESPGVPATPPGFLEDGIVDSLIPPGPSAGGGGGGKKTWIAIGAAAAVVAGVALLAGGSTSEPEVTEPPIPPSTPPVTSVSVPVAVACFDTHPNPPIINVGERITLDGRCSTPTGALAFSWDLGDGRRRDGPFIQPSYNSPGSFPVELVVRLESDSSMTDRIVKWIDVRDRGGSTMTTDPSEAARLRTSFVSEISGGPRGAVHASLELNEHVATDNTSPRQIASLGVAGENLAAGFARATRLEGVLWRFDFSRAEHFESGSLRVELGDVVSIGSHTVVFRLVGTQGQVRFRFRLAR